MERHSYAVQMLPHGRRNDENGDNRAYDPARRSLPEAERVSLGCLPQGGRDFRVSEAESRLFVCKRGVTLIRKVSQWYCTYLGTVQRSHLTSRNAYVLSRVHARIPLCRSDFSSHSLVSITI